MTEENRHVPLEGTQPLRPLGAVEAAEERPAGDELIEIDLLVKSRRTPEELAGAVEAMAQRLPAERRHLDHISFESLYGADEDKLEQLRAFAARNDLDVVRVDPETRLVVVRATAAALERAFRIEFTALRFWGERRRSVTGLVHLPRELKDVVEAVFGLDDVPRFDRTTSPLDVPAAGVADDTDGAAPHSSADSSWVERFYQFPESTTGKDQTVGIIMLGGGYFPADLDASFDRPGMRRPEVRHVELGGATNDPLDRALMRAFLEDMGFAPRDRTRDDVPWATLDDVQTLFKRAWWTVEASLDVQLVGTFANDARIVVYFAPNTERGKINALATALGDRENDPSVIACSWGAPEDGVNAAVIGAMDRLLQTAALKGVTVCYSSGDSGADVGKKDQRPHVHFPASSPHVLSCGGTILNTHERRAELVWLEVLREHTMASGGGFSRWFPRPEWQARAIEEFDADIERRGVPDVAGKADMADGYPIVVAGHPIAMGGTSAAAPMWAALVARLNEGLGERTGWITPLLYREDVRRALRPISQGGDGYFPAGPGWDPCTGCGSPRGRGLLEALRGH